METRQKPSYRVPLMSEIAAIPWNGLNAISTFSGCGGSSLGYKMAGFKVLWASEFIPAAQDTYRANHPGTILDTRDIRQVQASDILTTIGMNAGQLDLMDGSPPCQGFSTAGKRKFGDPRNSLFREFARLLKDLQPRAFVMENVTGMVKGCMKQAYLTIIAELRACGYRAKGEVLNAMYFNVPQSRERVIVIGVRNDLGIEPSHPKPKTKPLISRNYIIGVGIPLSEKYIETWKHTKPGETFFEGRLRMGLKPHSFDAQVLNPNKPAPTIRKQIRIGQSGLYHWERPEMLNIDSIKQLSSFPVDYIFAGKWKDQWARIGNSVPPNMMKAIAEHIKVEVLERHKNNPKDQETIKTKTR